MLTLKYYSDKIEAGCDEAGRGCLAGPVFAAAVILPENFSNEMLNDSKQLSEKNRNELRIIIEREALAWAVAAVDNEEIDKINILNASIEGMHRALAQLSQCPVHSLDGRVEDVYFVYFLVVHGGDCPRESFPLDDYS